MTAWRIESEREMLVTDAVRIIINNLPLRESEAQETECRGCGCMNISVLVSVLRTPASLIRVVSKFVRVIVIDCISEGTDSPNWQLHMSTGRGGWIEKNEKGSCRQVFAIKTFP